MISDGRARDACNMGRPIGVSRLAGFLRS